MRLTRRVWNESSPPLFSTFLHEVSASTATSAAAPIRSAFICGPLERSPDGELETFEFIAKVKVVRLLVAQRNCITETEQPERRKPLCGDTGRRPELAEVEPGIHREARLVEELGLAEV